MNRQSISRRELARSVGFGATLRTVRAAAGAEDRPNIVLLMGDDHAWHETGYNGHPHVKTPVLDEMAASGLRLNRFYAAAPLCSPTRGSILTGRHPNRYGAFGANWSIRPEEITIAQILRDAGYACGHFGKWHVGPVRAGSPLNPGAMGFAEWLSHDNFFEMNPYLSRNGQPPRQFHGESSRILADEAIRFIGAARRMEQPFFAVVWFGSPHQPYSGLAEDLALYVDLPVAYEKRRVNIYSDETGAPVQIPLRDALRGRYAEITAMDREIGRLREYLQGEHLRSNTLVWYCGDNGIPGSGRVAAPFRGLKKQVYDGGLRVPGLIEWPSRIRRPRISNEIAVTTDILPTLCAVTSLPLPKRPLDGVSLKPWIEGNITARRDPICFWAYDRDLEIAARHAPYLDPVLQRGTTPVTGNQIVTFSNYRHPRIVHQDFSGPRAVLDNQYKLVVDGDPAGPSSKELFDIRKDPREMWNIIHDQPEAATRLSRHLSMWQRSVLDSLTGKDYR